MGRCIHTKPGVVKRDVGIAYVVAVLFYCAVGAVPAIAFELGGQQYHLKNGALPQNILLAYNRSNWGAIVGQLLLTLQIMIIYPLIGNIIRRQVYVLLTGSDWPGWPKAITFSVILVVLTTAMSSVYPHP